MIDLISLWLPILVSAVAVFFASFVMWMVLPHHRSDWSKLPDEDALMDALRSTGVSQGQYHWPYCRMPADMKDPDWKEKMEKGPSGMMTVIPPGPMNMGKSMALSFMHNLIICIVVAYIARLSLPAGENYIMVFRVTGAAAMLGFCGWILCNSIWFHQRWSTTFKQLFDGVIYSLLVAGFFGWLWPQA